MLEKHEVKQVSLEETLRGVRECFLPQGESVDVNSPSVQKLLRKVSDLLFVFYPGESVQEVDLRIPSSLLIDLGLVPETAAKEIVKMSERKESVINKLRIIKTEEGFLLIKTHLITETGQLGGIGISSDVLKEESYKLVEAEGIINIKQILTEKERHIHLRKDRYVPEIGQSMTIEEREEPVTARSLNRLLALVVEGMRPGYFSKDKPLSTS